MPAEKERNIECICGCGQVEIYKFVASVFNHPERKYHCYVPPGMKHTRYVAVCKKCSFVGPMAFSHENAVSMFLNKIGQMQQIKESKKTGESPQQGVKKQ